MPILTLKAADFINKGQTKIRELATYLCDNFDYQGYQSRDSEMALIMLYEFRQLTKQLLDTNYGGLSVKEANDLIDYFTAWGDLNKLSTVTYTTYQNIIQDSVTVPGDTYALSLELIAEISNRMAGDSALSARVTVLENNQIDPSTIFPPGFFDLQNASNEVVWNDDPRLHTHSNKSILDQISSGLLTDLINLAAHYASYNSPGALHVTAAERTAWNAKVSTSALSSAITALSLVYAPIVHTHPISNIVNLQAQLDAMNTNIAAMAGVDGREVELRISADHLQWRYVGDVTWLDLGNVKGDQGIQGDPFTINSRGNDSDRFNSIYDSKTDQWTFLADDTGKLYYRYPSGGSATTTAGWSAGLQFLGDNGWAPVLGLYVVSTQKTVFQLIDWVGGSGSKPVLDPGSSPPTPVRWFLGAGGFTLDYTQAINVQGPIGATGTGPIIEASGNLAGRSAYDNEAAGFIYLRTDVSPNTIYTKQTGGSGDWTPELPWQGPTGGALSQVVLNTAGNPIVVDCTGLVEVIFKANTNIGGAKTWQMTNVTTIRRVTILFQITTTASVDQQFDANFLMNAPAQWSVAGAQKWTPLDVGKYKAVMVYDGTNWYMEISGPFA